MNELPKIVAGILAIAALGASLLNGIDPIQCTLRGGIAWFVGLVAGTVWNLFFTRPTHAPIQSAPIRIEPPREDETELEPESKEAASTS